MNERCRLISAPVEIDLGFREWRKKLFETPNPVGWFPSIGERVYLRPGTTLGGLCHTEAAVWKTDRRKQELVVRVQRMGGTWATRTIKLDDARPKP